MLGGETLASTNYTGEGKESGIPHPWSGMPVILRNRATLTGLQMGQGLPWRSNLEPDCWPESDAWTVLRQAR